MTSSFVNNHNEIEMSNLMFNRICCFAVELATGQPKVNHEFIQKFSKMKEVYEQTPYVDLDEYFSKQELNFWAEIFNELATKNI
ncbi:hypothetical protein [Bernardetia sp.]|uniref:hypothetical protein n=1 Tax=Bernardetia sp. TaxID=1937974 RepID=UPI0025C515E7|nr:hypothetical protein [Bernardetia sp.]